MNIESLLDRLGRRFLIDTLVELAQVPADVPMGHEVFIESTHRGPARYPADSQISPRLPGLIGPIHPLRSCSR